MVKNIIQGMFVGLWFLVLALGAVAALTAIYCAFVFAFWVAESFAGWLGL